MKGSAQFIIALLIVVMITVIFLYDKNIFYTKNVKISSSTAQIYLVENAVESMKRSLDSAVYFSGLTSLKEIFSAGWEWSSSSPTEQEFAAEVSDNILKKINPSDSVGKINLVWEGMALNTRFLDSGVEITGNKKFTAENSANPHIKVEVPGSFNRTIPIGAKKLFLAGRSLFDSRKWKAQQSIINPVAECEKKTRDAKIADGSYYAMENAKDALALSVMCGYGNEPGGLSAGSYDEKIVSEKIKKSLDSFSNDLKSDGLSYKFSHALSSRKFDSDSKEKVTAIVSVSITNQTSLVPIEGGFSPLTLQYTTKVEFEMPAKKT